MAKRNGRWIAGAINFIGSDTLFGRHWGAIEHHPFLHFEVCYYQAIDFAIQRSLQAWSRPARRASTSWRAATCRRPPTRRTYIADPAFPPRRRRLSQARAAICGGSGGRELTDAGPFRKTDDDKTGDDLG